MLNLPSSSLICCGLLIAGISTASAFSCKEDHLHYLARFNVLNADGSAHANAFVECFGAWDSENGSSWERTNIRGVTSLLVTICSENVSRAPSRIRAQCIVLDSYKERPVRVDAVFYSRKRPARTHPVLTPWGSERSSQRHEGSGRHIVTGEGPVCCEVNTGAMMRRQTRKNEQSCRSTGTWSKVLYQGRC